MNALQLTTVKKEISKQVQIILERTFRTILRKTKGNIVAIFAFTGIWGSRMLINVKKERMDIV